MKLSVVIPTLQKNKAVLSNLIETLANDEAVSEIILIDNSCGGFSSEYEKLRVIIPPENLFVNPSWNLGVREAKEDIVALLNDDIAISDNFCSNIIKQMTPEMGCIGCSVDYINEAQVEIEKPQATELWLESADKMCNHWGIAIFFYKTSYNVIPDELKIFCGDDWIFSQSKKHHKVNYCIKGQKIYHFGSLSSKNKKFSSIGDKDRQNYRKLTRHWWQFIFNIEPVFRGVRITICGIEILYHFDSNH